MRSPLIALAALTLAAAPLALTGAPAVAATCTAPELVNAYVDPGTVVLGVSQPKGVDITVNVRKHGCTVSHVDTDVFSPKAYVDTLRMDEVGTKDGITTYTTGARINPGAFANTEAGRFTTSIYVSWGSKNTNDEGPTFKLLRAARLTANATPEPVTTGATLTVKGSLTRASWDTLGYAGYADRTVDLQFRPAGGHYAKVATVTSGAGGAVRAQVKAGRDGCYRFVFAGSATTAKVTSTADCVDVS